MDNMLITRITGVLINATMNIKLTILPMLVFWYSGSALLVTMLIRDHFMIITVFDCNQTGGFPSKMIF